MVRKRISLADYAWLRMDDPNNLMVITGLMTFDAPLDYERFKYTVEHSFLRFERFRQRINLPPLPFIRPYWEEDPKFNLESHLIQVKLPAPGGQKELQDLISRLMSTQLDYARPLWEFYLVENYGNGGALVSRLHHSLADGIALMQVLLSLTDTQANPVAPDQPPPASGEVKPANVQTVQTHNANVLNTNSPWNSQRLWEEGQRMLSDRAYARYRTHQGVKLATTVGKLVLRWPDTQTVFKGPLGLEKRAAWSDPLPLDEVKQIRKAFQCTVNDVLLTVVAGALGRYIEARGEVSKNLNIHGVIPVNLRPVELDEELGNKFGLVFLNLPIGVHDPVERLRRMKKNMDSLKASVEPIATFGIINLLGAIPPRLQELAVDFFDTKGTTVMTNVPGTQTQLYLAGAPINTVMAWVPQTGRIAFGVSIISYNGSVWLGIATDKGLVPDPETLIGLFNAEYAELRKRAQTVQVEPPKNIKPLLEMLDQALEKLDGLLDEEGK
jgi:diacylglycerol O-acyltransferase / wax synthase